jgi:2-polyprenyl-3-methyl-5-hydroxy-6-metoxy-1,4-benzoquinol methylase
VDTRAERALSMDVQPDALNNQKEFYDRRFATGYSQDFGYNIYERCRLYTVQKVLNTIGPPRTILDYGCGQGRYIPKLHEVFPQAKLFGCDISDTGLALAQSQNPYASFIRMQDETVDNFDQFFDLVVSIEVLEHVRNVRQAIQEIVRVLSPGGTALITTPCANKFSLEWFLNWTSGGLQPSHDGFGRFASDEPGHLRRLTSEAMNEMFVNAGAIPMALYYRAHFFTTLVENRVAKKVISTPTRAKIALLDWHLLKHFSNGATMLALYQKH